MCYHKKTTVQTIFVRISTHENFNSLQLGARRNIKGRSKTLRAGLFMAEKNPTVLLKSNINITVFVFTLPWGFFM